MKYDLRSRTLSLALCICMILPLIMQIIPVYSVGEDSSKEPTEGLQSNVGCQAIFDWWTEFLLVKSPYVSDIEDIYYTDTSTPHTDGNYYWYLYEERFDDFGVSTGEPFIDASGIVMIITDYYYDEENGFHWYKVSAREGEELPAVLKSNPWILYTIDGDLYDPYLAIYGSDETIIFIEVSNGGSVFTFVISGPASLNDTSVSITPSSEEHTLSAIAYPGWFDRYEISITKADKSLWSYADGKVGIRYLTNLFDLGTTDAYFGGAYVYNGSKLIGLEISELESYCASDVIYTTSGSSSLILELLDTSVSEIGETGYFSAEGVALYDNSLTKNKKYLAGELPAAFTVGYSFIENFGDYDDTNDKEWYLIPYIDSENIEYFLVESSYVTLGKLPAEFGDGRVSVADKKRDPITEITVSQYQKPIYTAVSSLSLYSADVKYQWQVKTDVGGKEQWVDILGQNSEKIKFSPAMVATVLDENNTAFIRCRTSSALHTAYSAAIPVTVISHEYTDYNVTLSDTFTSSVGETVKVTVSGNIPSEASASIESADPSGISVGEGEKVAASLDISVKREDGPSWQPSDGESVTVTLDAEALGLENGDHFAVYHLHTGEVRSLGTYIVSDGKVEFATDGFSKFVLALTGQNYDELIDKYAGFNAWNEWIYDGAFDYFWLSADPSSDSSGIYTWSIYDKDFAIDQIVKIKEYFVDSESSLWFRVEAVNGLELPESLKKHPWVYMNNMSDYDSSYDTLCVFEEEDVSAYDVLVRNKYGMPAWDIYMYSGEKKQLTAETSLQGEVKYMWEVCYDTENSLWMQISGASSPSLDLSYAMLSGVLEDGDRAAIRCTAYNSAESLTSNVIIVHMIISEETAELSSLYSTRSAGDQNGVMPIAETKVDVLLSAKKEDGTVIHQEKYELEYNGSVSREVELPYVKGYDLYDSNGYKLTPDKTKNVYVYSVNYSNVTEGFEIVLTYKPGLTTYSVVYFLQNVNDDGYTQNGDPIIVEGITGEMTDPNNAAFAKQFDGFYRLLYESVQIAADGSTIIEVYYDRLYYKMLFDLDGGYGVPPVYARYGTLITTEAPSKAGYLFMGWDSNKKWTTANASDASDIDSDTLVDIKSFIGLPMPAYHSSYTAVWYASATSEVSVVIWGENANDDGFSHLKASIINAKPGASITYDPNGGYVCGYTEEHIHDETCTTSCQTANHTHTDECYTKTCTKEEHTDHTDACWSCGGLDDHTIACYTSSKGALSTTAVTDWGTLQQLNGSNVTVTTGGLYRIGSIMSYTYYFKLGDSFYQVYSTSGSQVNKNTTVSMDCSCDHTAHGSDCKLTCTEHTHTAEDCYLLICDLKEHEHTDPCYSCGNHAHIHGAGCELTITGMDPKIWEYSHSDTVESVAADGSSVLNVYFTRKEYTLKFYYAASIEKKSENTQKDTTYYVVGGSTYQFGSQAPGTVDSDDEISLLDNYMTSYISQRGEVAELPTLNTDGTARGYTLGTSYSADSKYTYYYVSFTAKYGANIYNLWPAAAFNNVYCYDHDHTSLEYAYVSAWNGEHNVYYSQHNSNETIKGKYSLLDDNLLWDAEQFGAYSDYEDVDGDGDKENSIAFLCFWENGANVGWSYPELYRYNIYVEAYPGMDTTGLKYRVYNNVTYYFMERYETIDDSSVDSQTYPEIEGFSHLNGYYEKNSSGKAIEGTYEYSVLTAGSSTTDTTYDRNLYQYGADMYFYYKRSTYDLVFFNKNATSEKNFYVMYNAPLAGYEYTPLPPKVDGVPVYEDGSVVFDGWYADPECTGNRFDFSSAMDTKSVILYAKWVPVSHDVSFYHSYEDMEKGNVYTVDELTYAYSVPHGSTVSDPHTPPADPTNGKYSFVGWFYKDALGNEQMWDFANTAVTSNVKIYAKWSSNKLMSYAVRFVYKDESGRETEIAAPIVGSALAGNTKTFSAKVGSELNDGYQVRYFPDVQSHSITINIDDESKNVYTFYYTYLESVPYTVYYLTEKNPGNGLGTVEYNGTVYYKIFETKEVPDNDRSIVTESAEIINGYVFDEYYKRLVINSAEGASNDIYFFYEKDTENGQFVVHYMIENLDGSGFEEHSAFTGKQPEDSTYTVPNPPKEIMGFTFDPTVDGTRLSGEITTDTVLELYVYYKRNTYTYTVKYLEKYTEITLHTMKESCAKWEAYVTESAVGIENYTLSDESPKSIQISANEDNNVIIFYYEETKATISYVPVGPDNVTGFGSVTPESESVKISSGSASGSTALPSGSAYKFVGWYLDRDCTVPVPEGWVDSKGKLTPKKDGALWTNTTYYARFDYNLTSLKVTKEGASNEDKDQTFIFNISGNGINIDITVHGNSSTVIEGLTVGQVYTVTEKTEWSWRYSDTPDWRHFKNGGDSTASSVGNDVRTAQITLGVDGEIVFSNTRTEGSWLDGDSWCDNIFSLFTNNN